MLGLIQAKLSGDCAPFLCTLTAKYNGMTGHEEQPPAMSRSLDLLFVMSGMRDSLADRNLPESIGLWIYKCKQLCFNPAFLTLRSVDSPFVSGTVVLSTPT